ncbi:hypothetical protein HRR83_009032 [Exophiala dermatitidis]|uniref:Uncharacterized protein n=1 Tax=Exophiala dermatitidis TaxID=5970 RepID=A0AAN6IQK7_EXODE|nr:hypothetical protein HRR77_008917 [Exophiala dermatitidis]KAJ4587177.1 hypothetical protein HRR83_009032 [Exophiala dermatitidis]KAJ4588974.1 hypothetical protein HRR84_008161 [Exophiala dermatitidis]KAJ4611671.1 hypothetical protein HRR86_009202 [Exophiala dermatitidis]KAJ4614018.1 hypothetical protein HRR88_008128 [Exophiala dermatitidis]
MFKYDSPLHKTFVIKKTSMVPAANFTSPLMAAFPEDSFALFLRAEGVVLLDTFYAVFPSPPPVRKTTKLTFRDTKGHRGEHWHSEDKVETACLVCG